MKFTIGVVMTSLLVGCGFAGTPIRLEGDPASVAALAGEWQGEYWSAYAERRGVISFVLKPGTDSAFGDVVMQSLLGEPLVAADPMERHRMHARMPDVLHVDFVRASGSVVRGALEAYILPDCQCVANTVFRGEMVADTLSGDYVTTLPSGPARQGRWRMVRYGGLAQ